MTWSIVTPTKAAPTVFVSTTDERFDSGPRWTDSAVDALWLREDARVIAGRYQRERNETGTEVGYKLGYEWLSQNNDSYRITLTQAPNAVTMAQHGLSFGLTRRLASDQRVEFDLGKRHWAGYDLYEGRAGLFHTFGSTELQLGARLSQAQGQTAAVPHLGISHANGHWQIGAQVFTGQALTDRTLTTDNRKIHTQGGQLSLTYQLTPKTSIRGISARSYETLGWKSTTAIVLTHDFN